MNIAIAGYNGFLGNIVTDYLSREFNVIPIDSSLIKKYQFKELVKLLSDCDVVINFCGFPIYKKWDIANKSEIVDSRYYSTILLFKAIESIKKEFISFINASSIGIYDSNDKHTELSCSYSSNFLSDVIKKWESAFFYLPRNIKHHYIARIGNVLDTSGGIFEKILLANKFKINLIPGNGDQTFSFIHLEDFRRAIKYLVKYFPANGIYNLVSEYPTTVSKLIDTVLLNTKTNIKIRIHETILKQFLGERSKLFIDGQYVLPEKLLEEEFVFLYPDISSAISNLISI